MATDTTKRLYGPAALTGAAADLYTAPALTVANITHIHVENNHTAAVALTLSVGADAAGTREYDAMPIPPGKPWDWHGLLVLAAAEKIQGFGSTASKLVITISGVETA